MCKNALVFAVGSSNIVGVAKNSSKIHQWLEALQVNPNRVIHEMPTEPIGNVMVAPGTECGRLASPQVAKAFAAQLRTHFAAAERSTNTDSLSGFAVRLQPRSITRNRAVIVVGSSRRRSLGFGRCGRQGSGTARR